jgi:hypothetical protein
VGLLGVQNVAASGPADPLVNVHGSGSPAQDAGLAAGALGEHRGHEVTAATGLGVRVGHLGAALIQANTVGSQWFSR